MEIELADIRFFRGYREHITFISRNGRAASSSVALYNATIGASETEESELSVQRAIRSAPLGAIRTPSAAASANAKGVWENRWFSSSPNVSDTTSLRYLAEDPAIVCLDRACLRSFGTVSVGLARSVQLYFFACELVPKCLLCFLLSFTTSEENFVCSDR